MSDERPDYVHCVKRPNVKAGWCGREISGGGTRGFFFTDVEHALLNGEQGGRLLLCPDCEVAICVSLRTASSGEKPVDVERMDALEMRWVHPGHYPPGMLTKDELSELQALKRGFEARYREPSTLPPEARSEIDRILAGKKRREEERSEFQRGMGESDSNVSDVSIEDVIETVKKLGACRVCKGAMKYCPNCEGSNYCSCDRAYDGGLRDCPSCSDGLSESTSAFIKKLGSTKTIVGRDRS